MTDHRETHSAGASASPQAALASGGRIPAGEVFEIPARQGRAIRLSPGQVLRIVNTHGTQVGDFFAFDAADPGVFLSMEHLRAGLRRLTPRPGDVLPDNRRQPLLTLLSDSSPGVHDTLIAACDIHRYQQLGHQGHHDNCADNLRLALEAVGARAPEVPCPLNLWMNIPVAGDGSLSWRAPVSRPGDQVRLRAEREVIAVISCCPMDLLPINGEDAVPRSLSVTIEA